MQIRQQKYSERAQLVCDYKTGQYFNYRQLIREPKHKEIWCTSAAYKFGCLAQGVLGRVKGTNTIFFVCKDQVPKDRIKDVTYGSFSCEIKQNKKEKHRTWLIAGGDRIHHPDNVGTPTANMTLIKVLLNSIISTENAQYVILDMKDSYLNTPMKSIRSAKQDDNYGASNIVMPCPGSQVIFHLVKDVVIIFVSSIWSPS